MWPGRGLGNRGEMTGPFSAFVASVPPSSPLVEPHRTTPPDGIGWVSSVDPSHPTVLGLEHELAASLAGPSQLVGACNPAMAILQAAGVEPVSLSSAQYLGNGARLYLDSGDHPEYATPECRTPQELVASDLAGTHYLGEVVERAEAALSAHFEVPVELSLIRHNSSPNGFSWGTHENYLVPSQCSWFDLAFGLATHLASRVCFTGAGTLIGTPAGDAGYRISQRAPFVGRVLWASAQAPGGKPMVLGRDEPLADPARFRRLQVCCGEASVAPMASLLKIGTTLVGIRLVEARSAPSARLVDPVHALHLFGTAGDLSARAELEDGRSVRAIDLQWMWLDAAWDFERRVGLSPDEAAVLPLWEGVLTDLEHDPAAAADRVDWLAKRRVLEHLAGDAPLQGDDARLVMADLSYHELAPRRSIGRRLVARGHLRPVVDERAVRHFVDHPPAGTRAAVRGALVQALQRSGRPYDISWTTCRVHVGTVRQEVSLMDPFANRDDHADALLAELDRLPATLGSFRGCALDGA